LEGEEKIAADRRPERDSRLVPNKERAQPCRYRGQQMHASRL